MMSGSAALGAAAGEEPSRAVEPSPAESVVVDANLARVLDALPDPVVVLDADTADFAAPWTVVWVSRELDDGPRDGALPPVVAALTAPREGSAAAALTAALRRELGFTEVRTLPVAGRGESQAEIRYAPLGAGGDGRRRWLLSVRAVEAQSAPRAAVAERLAAEERAQQSLSLVAEVSDILADVDSARMLTDIARLLSRSSVRWAGFYADGPPVHQLVGLAGNPPSGEPHRRPAAGPDPVRELFTAVAMRTLVLDEHEGPGMTGELLRAVREDPAFPAEPGELWLLPMLGRAAVLGVLVAVPGPLDADGPAATAEELGVLLELVARRVGMAMDNLQLYEREHRLAEALQHAMLPEQSAVSGLDVWSYYAPNSEHAQVGGDWYDVLNIGDSRVAVVVGDVVGHDIEAAAAMGQLRSVVRAYAAEFVEPATVLSRVDRLVAGMRISRPVSFVYAVLTAGQDRSWQMRYSRAGHLPPVLVRDGVVSQLDGAGGMLVGFGERPRHTAHITVLPGDVLLFYTDGLVERRDRPMHEGVAALVEVAAQIAAPDAAGVGEEVLLRLADAPEDDIAVVVVRVPGEEDERSRGWSDPRQRRWQMPADPQTIARARQLVLGTCEAWGVPEAAAVELVVSELVANAVMHGWGRVDLRLQDTGDGLRIEVEDANAAPPVPRESRPGRVGGFGLHIVSRLADWGWRPSATGKVVWARVRPGKPWESGS